MVISGVKMHILHTFISLIFQWLFLTSRDLAYFYHRIFSGDFWGQKMPGTITISWIPFSQSAKLDRNQPNWTSLHKIKAIGQQVGKGGLEPGQDFVDTFLSANPLLWLCLWMWLSLAWCTGIQALKENWCTGFQTFIWDSTNPSSAPVFGPNVSNERTEANKNFARTVNAVQCHPLLSLLEVFNCLKCLHVHKHCQNCQMCKKNPKNLPN